VVEVRGFGDVVRVLFKDDVGVDSFKSGFGGGCFGLPCLLGAEEEAIHVGKFNSVVVEEEELADAAASEHLGGHGPDASQPYNKDGQVADAFVFLNEAHAFEGHKPAVGVAVDDLGGHGFDFSAQWGWW